MLGVKFQTMQKRVTHIESKTCDNNVHLSNITFVINSFNLEARGEANITSDFFACKFQTHTISRTKIGSYSVSLQTVLL